MGQSGVVISYWLERVSVFIDSRFGTTWATPSRTHHTAMHTGAKFIRIIWPRVKCTNGRPVCSALMRWRTFLAQFNDSALPATDWPLLPRYFQSEWTIKGENYMHRNCADSGLLAEWAMFIFSAEPYLIGLGVDKMSGAIKYRARGGVIKAQWCVGVVVSEQTPRIKHTAPAVSQFFSPRARYLCTCMCQQQPVCRNKRIRPQQNKNRTWPPLFFYCRLLFNYPNYVNMVPPPPQTPAPLF